MTSERHKVFISYHHENDQWAKQHLLNLNFVYDVFIDASVSTGDISDQLSDESIRRKIRDEYLVDSSVTLLLVGTNTKNRKHILWELYSSMFDGTVNKKSGILIVELPSAHAGYFNVTRQNEKSAVFPEISNWIKVNARTEFESRHPYMPDLILDNLVAGEGRISIVPWTKIENNPETLRMLIHGASVERHLATYDLSRPMRERNYNPTPASSLLFGLR